MSNTINNGIPLVPENTIDPAAALNLSLVIIDRLLQLSVLAMKQNTPATGMAYGSRYIVGSAPTGAWAGKALQCAEWMEGDYWAFSPAKVAVFGTSIYLNTGSDWVPSSAGGGAAWGGITGALADQTDLAAALALKADTSSLGTGAFATVGRGDAALPTAKMTGFGGTSGANITELVPSDDANLIINSAQYRVSAETTNAWPGKGVGDNILHLGYNNTNFAQVGFGRGGAIYQRSMMAGSLNTWQDVKTGRNTTVDANGFLKAASPIARVSDSELDGTGVLEKVSTGHYRITQTQGLRLGGGWYIETPHDRNGEKYFNIEWYQNIEPITDSGFLDNEVEGIVIDIHCFDRVWDQETGRHVNGAPVDIPDGRWIDLRFNEVNEVREVIDE